jgi:hypothetical protein
MLDGFLLHVTVIAKLHIVSRLLFWANGQERVEFFQLPRDPGLIWFFFRIL